MREKRESHREESSLCQFTPPMATKTRPWQDKSHRLDLQISHTGVVVQEVGQQPGARKAIEQPDQNHHSHGMPASQVAGPSTVLKCQPQHSGRFNFWNTRIHFCRVNIERIAAQFWHSRYVPFQILLAKSSPRSFINSHFHHKPFCCCLVLTSSNFLTTQSSFGILTKQE